MSGSSSVLGQLQAFYVNRLPASNFMPPEGVAFENTGSIPLPAIGASAFVLQFKVPQGFNGMIKRIANEFNGGAFSPGACTWTIFVDATGVGTAQGGQAAKNFAAIPVSLGAVIAPSEIDGIRVKENYLVALQVTNVAVALAGQTIAGRLGGYFYPVSLEPPEISF